MLLGRAVAQVVVVEELLGGLVPPLVPGRQVVARQRLEHEAAVDEVGGRLVVARARHQRLPRLERELDVARDPAALDLELDDVADVAVTEHDVVARAVNAHVLDGAVVRDRQAIDRRDDIARHQDAIRRARVIDVQHDDTALAGVEPELATQQRVLEVLRGDAERRDHRLLAEADAIEERADDRRRHHLADVVDAGQLLERDADDLAIAEHRATAVAGVDRGIDRDREQVALAVRVALDLDARDHAFGDRDLFAADRVADHRDFIPQPRHRTQLRGLDIGEEVGRLGDLEQGEIGVVADRAHPCDRLVGL